MYGCGVDVMCTGTFCEQQDERDQDPFQSLRWYAICHLGAEDEDDTVDVSKVRELRSEDEFFGQFQDVIYHRGWPILKYGKGKAVQRCLLIDGTELSWGSKKTNGETNKSVPLKDLVEVRFATFEDAPPEIDPTCSIAFNIGNRSVLKIACYTRADAYVLIHGFSHLIKKASRHEQHQSL